MEGARFEVAFRELPFPSWMADGPSRVEFLFASARGQSSQPLSRIASGGEISRVMLALKGVLGSADTVGTLVFDEVDAGIGGATATAVGARLARLATTHQVIVVTHLAQVAAYADSHIVVRKQLTDGGAVTDATSVTGDERVREVARMLSGNESSASRVHAAELLASAHGGVTAH
jgi:DNA repair protein RecN (Recombination protein N)